MINEKDVASGDLQILEETAFNERVVAHPKLGPIRLRLPTLEIQRKIDAVGRAKKKFLKEARDTIVSEDGVTTKVQAYRSREQLAKEYSELGWWTDAEKLKLADLSEQHVELLAELEILGFESDIDIYTDIKVIFDKLYELCKEDNGDVSDDVVKVLSMISLPGAIIKASDITIIKEHSATTEVDDLLDKLIVLHKQYNTYVKLAQIYSELISLQTQQSQLFGDSWQDQLQYYLRLAQVFYCTEQVETHKPIWSSLEAIESEQDIELIRWIFSELNAFWQGISEETREKMNKYSFTNPRNTVNSSSEDSPVPQESLPDGELPVNTQESSTAVTVIADLSLIDKSS